MSIVLVHPMDRGCTVTNTTPSVTHHPPRSWLVALPLLAFAVACSESAAPDPVLLEVVGGDAQEAPMGTPVAAPLIVRVTDLDGEPRGDVAVEWAALDGAGSIAAADPLTDAEGLAEAQWTLGGEQGEQRVDAVARGERAGFRALATPEHPEDWSEMLEVEPVAYLEGEAIVVGFRMTSRWSGTLQLTWPTGCIVEYLLYNAVGDRVATPGFPDPVCQYWTRQLALPPEGSITEEWATSTAPLEPGEYTVRITFTDIWINVSTSDDTTSFPEFVTVLEVGGG
jgi:hypothetical protein